MKYSSYIGSNLSKQDLLFQAQAIRARRAITDSLVAFADALRQDRKFPPELRDKMIYLLSNEACELSSLPNKFRQVLKNSHYPHYALAMAINSLESLIDQIALSLPVDKLFLLQ